MSKNEKQESGRSLVEMIGVLAIMGLVTAAAFVLIQSGLEAQKRNRATDEIDILASNIRGMVAQATDNAKKFASLPTETQAGKILAKALLKSSDGKTPFDGTYSVYATDEGATFTVELSDIGAAECQAMAKRPYSHGIADCPDIGDGSDARPGSTVKIKFRE